jgi:hypothetical protein
MYYLKGAMGVMIVQGTEGAIKLPPADMLYAVEPEGVAMMRPSASTEMQAQRRRGREGGLVGRSMGSPLQCSPSLVHISFICSSRPHG